MARVLSDKESKRVLLVLFIPSVDRDGHPVPGQPEWTNRALSVLGSLFGGATAYPKAQGVWRDNDRGGVLIFDEPVVVQCYTIPADIEDDVKLAELVSFCRRMGSEMRQGEVGLVIGDGYFGIQDFDEE
jgi:hypothetical protein